MKNIPQEDRVAALASSVFARMLTSHFTVQEMCRFNRRIEAAVNAVARAVQSEKRRKLEASSDALDQWAQEMPLRQAISFPVDLNANSDVLLDLSDALKEAAQEGKHLGCRVADPQVVVGSQHFATCGTPHTGEVVLGKIVGRKSDGCFAVDAREGNADSLSVDADEMFHASSPLGEVGLQQTSTSPEGADTPTEDPR